MAGLFLVFVIFSIIAVAFVTAKQTTTNRNNDAFRQVAQMHGCRYAAANLFGSPMLVADVEGHKIVVRLEGKWKNSPSAMYHAKMPWPLPGLDLSIHSRGLWGRLGGVFESGYFATGDPEFDRRFMLKCSDRQQAAAILNAGARWHLTSMRHPNGALYLETDQDQLTIRLPCHRGNTTELDKFTRGCMGFLEQVLMAQMQGIEFVDPLEATIIEDATCQICGDSILTDLVFCRTCKTPHHADCWQYNGTCSTYGCAETHCDRPRLAK
jgi:hypothetical protein